MCFLSGGWGSCEIAYKIPSQISEDWVWRDVVEIDSSMQGDRWKESIFD